MRSEGLAHDERLPADVGPRPAYGEGLSLAETRDDVAERFDRGKDWPVALAIFMPVIAAYAAIGYGFYLAGSALF